jgi:hypothetical protein
MDSMAGVLGMTMKAKNIGQELADFDTLTKANWYRDHVVWMFSEVHPPTFHQGQAGEHELCEPVSAEFVTGLVKKVEYLLKSRSLLDCRYAAEYAEFSGSHCPIDSPCTRCSFEAEMMDRAENARLVALAEAAKIADTAAEYDTEQFFDPENTEEEKAAFGRGRMKSRNIAAAIRKLMEKE